MYEVLIHKLYFSKTVMKMAKTVWLDPVLATVGIYQMTCNSLSLVFPWSFSWRSEI